MKTNLLDYQKYSASNAMPEKVWLRDSENTFTFAEFANRAAQIGTELIQQNIEIGNVVAVFIPNSAHIVVADFGILHAGAAFLNIDVTLPSARIQAVLDSVQPKCIITTVALAQSLPSAWQAHALIYETQFTQTANHTALAARRAQSIDTDPACLITTSGSTGTPKAVALSHRGLIDFCDWFNETFTFSAEDVVGSLSPLFFDGYIPGLFMSLLHGGEFVILPKESAVFPAKLVEQMAEHKISFIFWVPSALVNVAKLKILDSIPLPSLRFVGFAGEVMPPSTLAYLRQHLSQAQFVNFYGPIEISVICTYFDVPKDFPEDQPVPIGKACANTRILILDEHDALCPPGKTGEICVAGSCVALGYWNNPEKTAQAFASNPLITAYHDTIYRTGDLATADEHGIISFVGRKDFHIKHQGYRMDLGEIEHIADIHLPIKACCVLYDKETHNIIMVYSAEAELPLQKIRSILSTYLPRYMLPTKYHFLETMPLNPNGKIDRRGLESKFCTAPNSKV